VVVVRLFADNAAGVIDSRVTLWYGKNGRKEWYYARGMGDAFVDGLFEAEMKMGRKGSVAHDRSEETMEAKTRWFRSLSLSERMDVLCSFTDLALSANPTLLESKNAQPVAGRIQIISRT